MKGKLRDLKSSNHPDLPKLNEAFNKMILGTRKGQEHLTGRILDNAKWLFMIPSEYLDQLILNLKANKEEKPDEQEAKNYLIQMLEALVPVKKHLEEAWGDFDIYDK